MENDFERLKPVSLQASIKEQPSLDELEKSIKKITLLNSGYLKDIRDIKEENQYLNFQVASLQEVVAQFPERMEKHPKTIQMNEENTRLKSDNDALKQDNVNLKKENNRLRQNSNQRQIDNDRLKKDIERLKSNIEGLKRGNDKRKREIERLNNTIERLKKDNSGLRTSTSFQTGSILVNAVAKPGKNTILMPFRLMKLVFRILFT